MLEPCRRFSQSDLLLAMLSTAMIIYFGWPNAPQKQDVLIQHQNGARVKLVIAVGSPAWQRVVEARERWVNSDSAVEESIYAWQQEVAAHYELLALKSIQNTGPALGEGTQNNSAARSVRLAEYQQSAELWQQHGVGVASSLRGIEEKRETRASNLDLAPIVMGQRFSGGKQRGAFAFALIAGLFAAGSFWLAALQWPRMVLRTSSFRDAAVMNGQRVSNQAELISEVPSSECFSLDLPASWFRVNQSVGVMMRPGLLCFLVFAAVFMAIR